MTEGKAKTKWCPQVRFPNLAEVHPVNGNKYSSGCNTNTDGMRLPTAFCCIASDCMMWVKHKDILLKGDGICISDAVVKGEGGHCGLTHGN